MEDAMRRVDLGETGRTRRLRLDKDENWIGGVCAGCANYFGIDPAFVRVGTVVTALFLPKAVIATYLIAWVLLSRR